MEGKFVFYQGEQRGHQGHGLGFVKPCLVTRLRAEGFYFGVPLDEQHKSKVLFGKGDFWVLRDICTQEFKQRLRQEARARLLPVIVN